MLIVSLLGGLGLLALPALTRRWGRSLHPSEWARLCMIAIAGGGLTVEVSLGLYAVPTLARLSGSPQLAELCGRMLVPLTPGGPAAGWAAAMAATALAVLAALGWSRTRRVTPRVRIEPGLGQHGRYGRYELVVLSTQRLVAASVPALPGAGQGQVVISDGLVDTLDPGELEAVLAHEAAHLRHNHHRYLAVTAAVDRAFAWFPVARRSTAALRVALERWADEEAAADRDRDTVRDALLRVTASLVAEPTAVVPSLAAFSAAESIIERLDKLTTGPPRPLLGPRLLSYCPGAVLGAVVTVALSLWLGQCVA